MPTLAGWLTGEQVPAEIIEQTLMAMGNVLGQHGGQPAHTIHPGAGLIAFSDTAYTMAQQDDAPVLDWVPDRRTLVYRRPLSGIHPLYYIENWPDQGNLLFASEIKALFAVGVPRHLHLAALDSLLRYGSIPAPWTAFKDIHVVPAGWLLRWQRAKTVINQILDYQLDQPLTPSDAIDELGTTLNNAAASMLPPHDQLVALTGGAPPSALATLLAARHTTAPFPVASFGYTKSPSTKLWKAGEAIAQACQHPFLAITGVDQPEFWMVVLAGIEAPCLDTRPLALHQLLHTVATATSARIAISGLGSHILLNTINHQHGEQLAGEQADILDWYGRIQSPAQTRQSLWTSDALATIRAEEPWEQSLHARKLARHASQLNNQRLRKYYLDLHLRLPDMVNTFQQLATQERMAVRSPYLNTHVIDLLTRLPMILDDESAESTLITPLVRRYIPNMRETSAKLPLTVPFSSLLNPQQSDLLQQTLSDEAIRATGIFDPQAVQALMERGEVSRELMLVFTTQVLCHLFFQYPQAGRDPAFPRF